MARSFHKCEYFVIVPLYETLIETKLYVTSSLVLKMKNIQTAYSVSLHACCVKLWYVMVLSLQITESYNSDFKFQFGRAR